MSSCGLLLRASCWEAEHVCATVLQLVVQHAEVDPYDVTTWLQLSKRVRKGLQQAVGNLSIRTSEYSPGLRAEQLPAFAHWLPSHAGLVSTLDLSKSYYRRGDVSEQAWAATEQMLSLALQLSSSKGAACSADPADTPTPALQLRSFTSNCIFQPAALRGLARSSCLTQLSLYRVPPQRFTAELCSALGCMHTLRMLSCSLQDPSEQSWFPVHFAQSLAGLSQLQRLKADGLVPAEGVCHLPASLTYVYMNTCHTAEGLTAAVQTPRNVNISQLTQLKELHLIAPDGVSARSHLPACLTSLTLVGAAEAVPGLFELQTLQLPQARVALPLLQRLWHLPKLRHLDVGLHACSQQQLQQVFDALGGITQLTSLVLFNRLAYLDFSPDPGRDYTVDLTGVQVQEQLGKLRQLQQLKLQQIKWDLEGASQLSVLTGLTQLYINQCGVSDMGLAVMFQRLTSLQSLKIEDTMRKNNMLYVAMGFLTNLESLKLLRNDNWVTNETLPLLSPLTNLTELILDDPMYEEEEVPSVSGTEQRAFLAGMPYLDGIEWY